MQHKGLIPLLVGTMGLVILVLLVFSGFVFVQIPRLPIEVLGVGMLWFSMGYARPFSRLDLGAAFIIWVCAILFDPLIWQQMPAIRQIGSCCDWKFSFAVNSMVCGAGLVMNMVGSLLGRRSNSGSEV